jgi:hypothetical protein
MSVSLHRQHSHKFVSFYTFPKLIKQLIELRNILIHKLMDLKSRHVNKLCNLEMVFGASAAVGDRLLRDGNCLCTLSLFTCRDKLI